MQVREASKRSPRATSKNTQILIFGEYLGDPDAAQAGAHRLFFESCHGENLHLSRVGILTQASTDLDAVHAGQVQVQHH